MPGSLFRMTNAEVKDVVARELKKIGVNDQGTFASGQREAFAKVTSIASAGKLQAEFDTSDLYHLKEKYHASLYYTGGTAWRLEIVFGEIDAIDKLILLLHSAKDHYGFDLI